MGIIITILRLRGKEIEDHLHILEKEKTCISIYIYIYECIEWMYI
jgi:hypothetical protein